MRVEFLATSYDEDCGISEYTTMLENEMNMKTHRTEVKLGGLNPLHYLKRVIEFVQSDSDVFHVQHEYGIWGPKSIMSWVVFPILILARMLTDREIVMTLHSAWSEDTISPPFEQFKQYYVVLNNQMLALSCDYAFFLSEETQDEFEKSSSVSSTVLPHGVYSETHPLTKSEACSRLRLPDDEIWCLPGFVRPVKGHGTFIQMASEHPNITFVVGGGIQEDTHTEFEEELKNNAPDNVIFTDVLDHDEFHWLFSAVDMVILPYHDVSQSGIINMCAAYNMPTITSDLSRFRDLEDRHGFPQTEQDLIDFNGDVPQVNEGIESYRRENKMERVTQIHYDEYQV